MVVGPRQAGKTTLVRTFASDARPYLTLDDPATLAAAADPVAFLRRLDGAVIDEVQRAPQLLLPIKESVDRDPRPGRFLLTGSTNVMALPRVGDSLAGRLAIVTLLPLSRTEIEGGSGDAIDRLFAGEQPAAGPNPVTGDALIDRVVRGGYPDALNREERRRAAWHEDYLALVLDRDVRDIADVEQLEVMPRLMKLLAEQAGQIVNHNAIATALRISVPTVQRYIAIIERLFLLRSLRPWHSNRISRLIKSPKAHLLDSGLLATLRESGAAALAADRSRLGPLFETFVLSEVLKMLSWSRTRATISHFRTKEGEEVDLVLEDRNGRVVGIEVKSAAMLHRRDFAGLRKLREAAGDQFAQGVLLHDHDRITPHDGDIRAAPISMLWR